MKYKNVVLTAVAVMLIQHFLIDGHELSANQFAAAFGRAVFVMLVAMLVQKLSTEKGGIISIFVMSFLMYIGR